MKITSVAFLFGLGAIGTTAFECTPAAFDAVLPPLAKTIFAVPVTDNATFDVSRNDPGNVAYPISPTNLPALCAVSINVTSSNSSSYKLGLFLPTSWNGRFLAVGNGGFLGGLTWLDASYGAQRGFASMTTNTGHNGTNGDSTWALHQPEKKIDWAYRAMHGSVVIAKQVVSAFYSKKSFTSFYAGCSTGGYQGLKEVQMFPEDFDGVLVSAPAWWHSHLQTWSIKVGLYNLPVNSSHHIPASLFPTIGAEVLRQCDPSDGLVDGIISDPRRCDVNLEALLCTPSANKSACLTSPQISTLYKIYTDWYEADQTFVYNHLELGSESQWSLINTTSGTPDSFSIGYVQNWVLNNPNWTWQDFNYSIVQTAERLNPAMHDASNYNISAFRARGGKLLHYHGYADGFIPTGSSVYYYKHVQRALAPMGIELDDWYRLFLIPGMNHCSKSAVNAPWYIAGPNQAGGLVRGTGIRSVPGFEDAEHDMLMALVRWVEQKQAPDQIIGTKYKNDTVSEGVLRQRPICNYPNRAVYNGSGDVDDARSWKCVKGLQ